MQKYFLASLSAILLGLGAATLIGFVIERSLVAEPTSEVSRRYGNPDEGRAPTCSYSPTYPGCQS